MQSDKTIQELLYEKLQKILWDGRELRWNPNKTSEDFQRRIKERTGLTDSEFCKILQSGINSVKLPVDVAVCLYFMKSKFVLVLNTKERIITTIRDGKWEKPGNSCKHTKIVNEDIQRDSELIDIFNSHSGEGWEFKITEEFDIEITSKCNVCFSVEL